MSLLQMLQIYLVVSLVKDYEAKSIKRLSEDEEKQESLVQKVRIKPAFSSEEFIDFLEDVQTAATRLHHHHHHKSHRRHKMSYGVKEITSVDENGKEYVECQISGYAKEALKVKRCYRPPSPDKIVGCFAVWDGNSASLNQGCWIQQQISMHNCEVGACVAKRSRPFCCCFGKNCNEKLIISKKNSLDSL